MNHRCPCSSGPECRDINTAKKNERVSVQQGSAYRTAPFTSSDALDWRLVLSRQEPQFTLHAGKRESRIVVQDSRLHFETFGARLAGQHGNNND